MSSIIKKSLTLILVIISIPLIVAIFMDKKYSCEKEVVINKPKEQVFEYIRFLKNQDNYSKWATMDPKMIKTYSGNDGTVGFVSAWDSKIKDVGAGEQEIKNITAGSRIDYELRFKKPFESTEEAYMSTESVSPQQTKVKWGMHGEVDYPWNFMMLFMNIEEMIGNDLQTGLNNLKTEMENQ